MHIRENVEAGESVERICLYAAAAKFRSITGNRRLTEAQVQKLIELLDEVSPKGVFKEFNDELRKMKADKK